MTEVQADLEPFMRLVASSSSHPTPSSVSWDTSAHEEGAKAVNQEHMGTRPGIVVLSLSLQVLHINRQAMMSLDRLKHTTWNVGTERAVVAAPLFPLCQGIVERLQSRLRSNNWERFQQNRTIGESTHTISLKGTFRCYE